MELVGMLQTAELLSLSRSLFSAIHRESYPFYTGQNEREWLILITVFTYAIMSLLFYN
jgi:hypothetical protein